MNILNDSLLVNGQVQRLLRSMDWSDALFPHTLSGSAQFNTALQLALSSSQPASLLWGSELLFIYNDAYIELLGDRHPQSLGLPFLEVCKNIKHLLEPCIKQVLQGNACFMENVQFNIASEGNIENAVLTLSFIPLRNDEGQIFAVFNSGIENTRQVQAESRFQKIVDQAATGVVETDIEGKMTLVNKKFCSMLGYSAEELLGKGVIEITAPGSVSETAEAVAKLFAGGPDVILEKQYLCKDGSLMWAISSVSALRSSAGKAQGIVAIVVDITEQKIAEEKIRYASHHDLLTGLPNRAMLFEYAYHLLPHNKRNNLHAAVLFVDLDRFKPINDTHGHEIGDVVLKQVAGRLAACLREEDIVIRLGGDEFVILLQEIDDTVYAVEVACHIISRINKPYHIGELNLSLSTSVGISIFPEDGQDIDVLISHADMAMFQAKQAGRNSFQFYSAEYAEATRMQMEIEQQLKTALTIGNFHLCYQPVVDIRSRALISVEALLRWHFDEIGPERFVPIAEATGIINSIGQWLLKEASRQHKSWLEHGLPAIPIAINVSAVEFRDRDFANRVEKIIQEHGIGTDALQLEVTETAVMDDIEHAASVLARLHSLGIKILLDDFGTGHSSMAYLARLPLDKVKIDKSFMKSITHDIVSRAVTNAMIALAHTVNLEVVAEGVESESVLEYLSSQGCSQAQGYYFSKPMSGEFFESWYWANGQCVKCIDESE